MFEGMGIAALLVPVPVWFYLRGAKIREKSAFAPTFPKPPVVEESDGDHTEGRTH
jgi:DHA1 family multidrug resistance protein-like MFS transporter